MQMQILIKSCIEFDVQWCVGVPLFSNSYDNNYNIVLHRCLNYKESGCLPFAPDKASAVIMACCVLHNMCIRERLNIDEGFIQQALQQEVSRTTLKQFITFCIPHSNISILPHPQQPPNSFYFIHKKKKLCRFVE